MPVNAPLSDEPMPGQASVETGVMVRWIKVYTDAQGRKYPKGKVTAKRRSPLPVLSAEADVVDGFVSLGLEPGQYVISAMLRDADNVRTFTSDDVTLTQEGS